MNYNLYEYLNDNQAYIALGFFSACLAGSINYGIWLLLSKGVTKFHIKKELLFIKGILCCFIAPLLFFVFRMVTIGETAPRVTYFTTPLVIGFSILTVLWLIGAALTSVRMLILSIRARKIWETSQTVENKEWLAMLDKWKQKLGVRKNITLHCDCDIPSPGMIYKKGYHILLPQYEISDDEMNMVLLHEIMHIKRRDIVLKDIACLVRIFYSFLPFFRRLSKKVVDWTEVGCDMACCEAGIEEFTRKDYFTCIINLKLRSQNFQNSDMMYCFFEQYTMLDFRIDTLKVWNERRPKLRIGDLASIGLLVVVLSVVSSSVVSFGLGAMRDGIMSETEVTQQKAVLEETNRETMFANSNVYYCEEDILNQEQSTDFSLQPGEVRVYNIPECESQEVILNVFYAGGTYEAGYICEDDTVAYVKNKRDDSIPIGESVRHIFIKNTDTTAYDVELFLNKAMEN